jgi:hypothetical protein
MVFGNWNTINIPTVEELRGVKRAREILAVGMEKMDALFRGRWKALESEKEDVTAPEMIKILAELLMTGTKADEELIENIKQELLAWRDRN